MYKFMYSILSQVIIKKEDPIMAISFNANALQALNQSAANQDDFSRRQWNNSPVEDESRPLFSVTKSFRVEWGEGVYPGQTAWFYIPKLFTHYDVHEGTDDEGNSLPPTMGTGCAFVHKHQIRITNESIRKLVEGRDGNDAPKMSVACTKGFEYSDHEHTFDGNCAVCSLVENIGTFVNEAVKLKGKDEGLTPEQMREGNRYIPSLRDEWKKLRNDSRFDVASERRTAELYFPVALMFVANDPKTNQPQTHVKLMYLRMNLARYLDLLKEKANIGKDMFSVAPQDNQIDYSEIRLTKLNEYPEGLVDTWIRVQFGTAPQGKNMARDAMKGAKWSIERDSNPEFLNAQAQKIEEMFAQDIADAKANTAAGEEVHTWGVADVFWNIKECQMRDVNEMELVVEVPRASLEVEKSRYFADRESRKQGNTGVSQLSLGLAAAPAGNVQPTAPAQVGGAQVPQAPQAVPAAVEAAPAPVQTAPTAPAPAPAASQVASATVAPVASVAPTAPTTPAANNSVEALLGTAPVQPEQAAPTAPVANDVTAQLGL